MSTPKEVVLASVAATLRTKLSEWQAERDSRLKQQEVFYDHAKRIAELDALIAEAQQSLTETEGKALGAQP